MKLVLDTGGLLGFERGDRRIAAELKVRQRRQEPVVTSSGCVAQSWRSGGPRQALLARLLNAVDERPLDDVISKGIGTLCAATSHRDVIDGHVALLVENGDTVATSDPADLKKFLGHLAKWARIVRC